MQIKKRTTKIISAAILLALVSIIFYLCFNSNQNPYQFKGNTLYYSKNRGAVSYNKTLIQQNTTFDIYKITFQSKNFLEYKTKIYGLLFMPKSKEKVPAFVYLPGGGSKKENVIPLASRIAEQGCAVLAIDQRGIGETGGIYLNFDQDYQVVSQGKEPIQHLSVYDALRTFDVLKNIKEINPDKIGIIGESMGGRYAMIAAAIEKRLKGVIVISSSGFHIKENPAEIGNNYLISIDPDHYVANISPEHLIMFQGDNDTITHKEDAELTYSLAKEPKDIFIAKDCSHGFCEKMWPKLQEYMKSTFG